MRFSIHCYSSGCKLRSLIKLFKWSNKWSMVTLRFFAPVTTVEPETLLWWSGSVYLWVPWTSTVFYQQAWYHSGACVTMSTIFFSLFAPAYIIFLSTLKSGPLIYTGSTAKILKNWIFYCLTYFLHQSKEEIQRYQTTPKVSLMMQYLIFWIFLIIYIWDPYGVSRGSQLITTS